MSASGDLYRCPTCGASLSLEQLRGTDCPFCHTVFPHHGRAAEQAALVNQIMNQQMGAQHPMMHQGWGPPGGAPPQVPGQYGAPPPGYGQPGPYGAPNAFDPTAQIERSMKRSLIIVFAVLAFTAVLVVGISVAVFVLH